MNTYRNYEIAMPAILPKIGSSYATRKQNQKKKKTQDKRFAASDFKHRKK